MTRHVPTAFATTLFVVFSVFSVFSVSSAAAQDARATVERRTRPGDRLTVDVRGQGPIEGRLMMAGADVLIVESFGRPVPISYSEIDRVRRRRNGVLLGSIIGLGAGLTFGIPVRMLVNLEDGNGDRALLTLAAYGLGLGLAIDAGLSVNRTIYQRSTNTVRFELAPHPHGVTAAISARW